MNELTESMEITISSSFKGVLLQYIGNVRVKMFYRWNT